MGKGTSPIRSPFRRAMDGSTSFIPRIAGRSSITRSSMRIGSARAHADRRAGRAEIPLPRKKMDQDGLADENLPPAGPQDSGKAARVAFLILAAVVAVGVVAAIVFRPGAGPPPKEIADDPLLV